MVIALTVYPIHTVYWCPLLNHLASGVNCVVSCKDKGDLWTRVPLAWLTQYTLTAGEDPSFLAPAGNSKKRKQGDSVIPFPLIPLDLQPQPAVLCQAPNASISYFAWLIRFSQVFWHLPFPTDLSKVKIKIAFRIVSSKNV